MKRFAFVSRHGITDSQNEIAASNGISLHAVGDLDAFAEDLSAHIRVLGTEFNGVVCVHPLIAMECIKQGIPVGVFNNVRRSAPGEPPRFETTKLVVVEP